MNLKKISLVAISISVLFAAGCSQQSEEERRVAGEKEYNTAIKYLAGIGDVKMDQSKALEHLEKAYKLGNEQAAIVLATNYMKDEKKRGQGLTILKKLADQGNDDAMRIYGYMSYSNPDGTVNSARFEESNKYILMSIEKNNKQALLEYPAFLYNSGHKEMVIPFLIKNSDKYDADDFLVKAMQEWVLSLEKVDSGFVKKLYEEVAFLNKQVKEEQSQEVEKKS